MMGYLTCLFSADGLAKKFGLTPEQFGENLRDSYQRHETEQFPAEPMELAKDYVCRQDLQRPPSRGTTIHTLFSLHYQSSMINHG